MQRKLAPKLYINIPRRLRSHIKTTQITEFYDFYASTYKNLAKHCK